MRKVQHWLERQRPWGRQSRQCLGNEWNGPKNDLHGSISRRSHTILPLVQSPFRKVKELVFRDAKGPHVAAGCHDDALHEPELGVERNAFGWRQWLAVLIEHGD